MLLINKNILQKNYRQQLRVFLVIFENIFILKVYLSEMLHSMVTTKGTYFGSLKWIFDHYDSISIVQIC